MLEPLISTPSSMDDGLLKSSGSMHALSTNPSLKGTGNVRCLGGHTIMRPLLATVQVGLVYIR